MSEGLGGSERFAQGHRDQDAGEGPIEIASSVAPRSASIMPLIVLFQRAWELAHTTQQSLDRLEHAAEAAALAQAMRRLLAEAGDQKGRLRWTVRLSEARHWCAAVHDALAFQYEDEKGRHGQCGPQ